jgi:ornithine cyclodeaminase/alanine dehydrogenase-like protein (mu-crystallin family)
MLILTATEVERVLGMPEAFAATREAALAHVRGETDSPVRTALSVPASHGEVLVMPGVVGGTVFGTKTWFSWPERRGDIPGTGALILLLDPESGRECLMDAGAVTDLRTGAMTGLAAERLAPAGASRVGMVGTGIQARTQAMALVHALPGLAELAVTSRDPDRRARFAADLEAELRALHPGRELRVRAVPDARTAVEGADVVVAATTSGTPVVDDAWVTGDVLVCGVGSHDRRSAELPPELVARADTVVVDTLRGGVDGAGDVADAIERGLLDRDRVVELGRLLEGEPVPERGLSVFKSVGFSAADVVCGAAVLAAAVAAGLGTSVDLHHS